MFQVGNFDLYEVLAYLFMWVTLYFLLCLLNPGRSYEWHCRSVTVLHAAIISALAAYGALIMGPNPFTEAGGPNNSFQVRTVSICLGYFLFDFSWCLYFKTEGPVMLAHHFLSVVGLTVCLVAGRYGTEMIATIAGAEITNPLLQLRWFLRATGRHHSLMADVVDWAFMLSFGFVRLGLGSVLLYMYYQQNSDYIGRFGGTSIYLLSVVFFISIVNYAVRKYTKRYRAWVKRRAAPPPGEATPTTRQNGDLKEDVSSVGIIKEQEIPSPREIKTGLKELSLRKNCMVQKVNVS
ncbi:TLC domain-containing protein 5 [Aplysia californica]|uniref:TLC domain-containing protein 5 n=1 Tax=Aplysia californica TaxID=6500 RepID=A0ABM0K7S4_APLCA|nr:TLC domain-containing protein 5 [Aplysia californica]XP_005110791.1 TLC domain-containing protein 5 [Aplysia californica]